MPSPECGSVLKRYLRRHIWKPGWLIGPAGTDLGQQSWAVGSVADDRQLRCTASTTNSGTASQGTVNLSNPRAIFAGSPPRFTRSRVTYEAYVVNRTSTRPQVDSAEYGQPTSKEHLKAFLRKGVNAVVT